MDDELAHPAGNASSPDLALLLEVLSTFARAISRRYDVSDVLYQLAEHATAILGADGAGVSLADANGVLHAATALHEPSTTVERAEEREQQGPSVDAYRSGPIAVGDLDESIARWPAYHAAARDAGVRAALSVPLHSEEGALGALNLHCFRPRAWSSHDIAAAATLADMAASYVVNAWALERSELTATQLQEALQSRILIEQAKGIISADFGTSVDEAFDVLRRHARSHNTALRDVARAVIEDGLRPPRA